MVESIEMASRPVKRLKKEENGGNEGIGGRNAPKHVAAHVLEGHTKGVTSIKFSPDGLWLASACTNRLLRLC